MKKSISIILTCLMLHASVAGALNMSRSGNGDVMGVWTTRCAFAVDHVGLDHMGRYHSAQLTFLVQPHTDPATRSILLELQGNPGAAKLLHQAMLEIAAGVEPGATPPDLNNFDSVLIRLSDDAFLKMAAKAARRVSAGMQDARENRRGIDQVIDGKNLGELNRTELRIVQGLSFGLRGKDSFPFWPEAERNEILRLAEDSSRILAQLDSKEIAARTEAANDVALRTIRSGFDEKDWPYLPDAVWGGPEANRILMGYANPLNPGTLFPTLGAAIRDQSAQLRRGILRENVPAGPWGLLPVEALEKHLQDPRIRAILAAEGGTAGQPNTESPKTFSRNVEQLLQEQRQRFNEVLAGDFGWAMIAIAIKKASSLRLPFIQPLPSAKPLNSVYALFDQAHQAVKDNPVTEALFLRGVRLGGKGLLSGPVLNREYTRIKSAPHAGWLEIGIGTLVAGVGAKLLASLAADGFPLLPAIAMIAAVLFLGGWAAVIGIRGLRNQSFLTRYPEFRGAMERFERAGSPAESPAATSELSDLSASNGSASQTSNSVASVAAAPDVPTPAGT